MRVPEAASGCPTEMAPPLTLVISRLSPSSFSTPRSWGASLPLGAYRRSRRPESESSRNSMLAIA